MLPRRPAAYTHPAAAADQQTLTQAAAGHGWPQPVIYHDSPPAGGQPGPALERLHAAISTGRHDALLLPLPRHLTNPAPLMRLLACCTRHGVTVTFIPHQ